MKTVKTKLARGMAALEPRYPLGVVGIRMAIRSRLCQSLTSLPE